MAKLEFNYDSFNDTLTIEGKKYSGEIFRMWSDSKYPAWKSGNYFQLIDDKSSGEAVFIRTVEPSEVKNG